MIKHGRSGSVLAAMIAAAYGAPSSLAACPPCTTGECFASTSVYETSMYCSHGWTYTLNPGGWNVVAATGKASARAVGVGFYSSMNWECFDPAPWVPGDWVVLDADSQSGDILAGSVSASATTGPSPFGGISGWCSVGGNAFSGGYSKQDQLYVTNWEEEFSNVEDCWTLTGRLHAFELATGFGSFARNYTFERVGPGDMSWDRSFSYSLWVSFAHYPFCTSGLGPSPSSADVIRVDFVSVTTAAYTMLGNNPQVTVSQGLLAVREDGTTVRMGFFDDDEFDVGFHSGGFSINGTGNVTTTMSNASIVNVSDVVVHDTFHRFDGNVTGDDEGEVCWEDRALMIKLQGVSFGQAAYTPRADANLDGVIDADDVAALNQFGCSADVNCDGVLDTDDFYAYMDLFTAGDMSADMNGDGLLNIADYTTFVNVFAIGCP